ncbi:phospholipase D family protein [Comamonas sp. UBA7528]|uniref:phospholipase D family protein n=1 Tax=Comamonas sp. UBA7528 TaxID=1946391 RepID=UPI0025BE31B4|nr:phospholipase D family protein [Comamonas sp. UBA7528]
MRRPLLSWHHRACALLLCLAVLWLTGCAQLPQQVQRTPSSALAQPQSTALGQLLARQRQQAGTPYHSAFALLGGAEAAYTSRLALVQAAQKTLDIQYYAIHADASTARLLEEVARAAARGVRVRMLLDDFHSAGKDAQVMRMAFVPGVEMRMFNPVMGARSSPPLRALSTLTDFSRAQQRMHNKLFLADNMVGIAGGRNLGDAYFDGLDSDNFIDLDIMAGGAVVRLLSRSFDTYWNDSRAYPVESLLSLAELDAMLSPAQHARQQHRTTPPSPVDEAQAFTQQQLLRLPPMDLATMAWIWAPGVVLADRPTKVALPDESVPPPDEDSTAPPEDGDDSSLLAGLPSAASGTRPALPRAPTANQKALGRVLAPVDAQDSVVDGLLALVDRARSQLLIVSPYFVPGADMKAAFRRAVQRGVQVRILTNSLASNDAPLAHAGYARHRQELLDMGVQLYELRSVQPGSRSTLRSSAGQISGSSGQSRAMLHTKLMVMDGQLTVVGSMNLDMRSQLQNTEIALLVASRKLSAEAARNIEESLDESAWHVTLEDGKRLLWRAPSGSDWGDQTSEPDASLPLRMLIRLIGPLAPDHLL